MKLFPRSVLSAAAVAALTAGGLIASAPESQAAQTKVVCKASVLTVRAQPTSRSRALAYLRGGQAVTATPVPGTNFSRLASGGYVGHKFLCAGTGTAYSATRPAGSGLMLQPTTTNGSYTVGFGWRVHPITRQLNFHRGLDIGRGAGMPVYAAATGRVTINTSTPINGNYVTVEHGSLGAYRNVGTYYMHLSRSFVRPGQWVRKGQVIGYTGSTGRSTVGHLHFAVRAGGAMVNPEIFLGSKAALRAW